MNFRTEIKIPVFDFKITHQDKLMMIGSCFVENISKMLILSGFNVDLNPFGITYNPASVAKNLNTLLEGKKYTNQDLFESQGCFHSYDHHSQFSDFSSGACLNRINERLAESSENLKQISLLMVTFGTAFAYSLKETGKIVSNCHKLPEKIFERNRLNVEEIVSEWDELILKLNRINPEMKILFTVSPIRHWKDGAHENQLSKSTLLLAIDMLIKKYACCYYFPSYEIMMDDLRDYRYYSDDMVHPSNVAIEYIWEKFSASFFDKKTSGLITSWIKIQRNLEHKPFNPNSEQYKELIEKTKLEMNRLKNIMNGI